MINYLTAVTLINDKHIRMFMSACKESDLIHLQSLNLHQVRLIRSKNCFKMYSDRSFFSYTIDKSSAVKFISQLKSLRNLRIQSIGEIQTLIIMIFCLNGLPELKSFECINSEYQTNVIFPGCQPTNIESLTVDCVLYNLSNLLLQTPKLKYLNIILTNYGPNEWTLMSSPLPMMMNLVDLRMEIPFISYIHLSDLMKSMPNLKILELSGTSMGENIDNGQQLKQLFGHLHELELDNLECLTSAKSVNKILSTFNDEFWLDVTCSIKYNRAYLSGFGHAKVGEY
jgi:hypothetical protein